MVYCFSTVHAILPVSEYSRPSFFVVRSLVGPSSTRSGLRMLLRTWQPRAKAWPNIKRGINPDLYLLRHVFYLFIYSFIHSGY